ncbi:Aconitate hydratase 1 [Paraburkholderia piptadeniae]|uniref:Aconitate hydratase A n=1 Tax=Paraburkholderia piptadeniae TaxID=1701573 RepID=A0A1N7SUA2_9BURK|nr:aconitate hydratase AcnA [Paraburkholderia piptadeniae]SIT51055.1 Aconitate hydratase 1 [Paraburkholderia piptadeniae]
MPVLPRRCALDSFGCRRSLPGAGGFDFFSLPAFAQRYPGVARWPLTKRLFLENLLRHEDGELVDKALIERFVNAANSDDIAVPFFPARIAMQDYAGISALVDFAGLRDELVARGRSADTLMPAVPVDLVVDHSLQVVAHGTPDAAARNLALEYRSNHARYAFLRWAEQAFDGLSIVPPGRGILHQINVEALATGVRRSGNVIHFDSVVGTDSHTPMINGLGVPGWGVGGVEALAVMLGQPVWLPSPRVVGVRLIGRLRAGVHAADVALSLAHFLREAGVVGTFLEFYGSGVDALSPYDRATIANMTPEYGATMSLFPFDNASIVFVERAHPDHPDARLLREYLSAQQYDGASRPDFERELTFDLGDVRSSVAGPRRPHDLRALSHLHAAFREALPADRANGMVQAAADEAPSDGAIAIAAITSCTNTANPKSILAAALLARNAAARGLRVPDYVKRSFTPGSVAVERYLRQRDLLAPLEALGFHIAGFGCATCVGNSGELEPAMQRAIAERGIVAAAVLSGNRNFDARIHPAVRANFLMSPLLVIALAIAGRVTLAPDEDPLTHDAAGQPVWLRDLLPEDAEVEQHFAALASANALNATRAELFSPNTTWLAIEQVARPTFAWRDDDTYFQRPAFLGELMRRKAGGLAFAPMRPLVVLGDDITTDHISPVGRIAATSEAGRLLQRQGVAESNFNTYGARRGNAEVMVRGVFDNPHLDNALADGRGPHTRVAGLAEPLPVFAAAQQIRAKGHAAVVVAGRNYGSGSARDWAAKGQRLIGIDAVIAGSFERIHRTNLVMFGVAPIVMREDVLARLKATVQPDSVLTVALASGEALRPKLRISVTRAGDTQTFDAQLQVETGNERKLLEAGGLLGAVEL